MSTCPTCGAAQEARRLVQTALSVEVTFEVGSARYGSHIPYSSIASDMARIIFQTFLKPHFFVERRPLTW